VVVLYFTPIIPNIPFLFSFIHSLFSPHTVPGWVGWFFFGLFFSLPSFPVPQVFFSPQVPGSQHTFPDPFSPDPVTPFEVSPGDLAALSSAQPQIPQSAFSRSKIPQRLITFAIRLSPSVLTRVSTASEILPMFHKRVLSRDHGIPHDISFLFQSL